MADKAVKMLVNDDISNKHINQSISEYQLNIFRYLSKVCGSGARVFLLS